jgi:ubiquinone/menaquinone biosynthesis C-methylase UbiE
MAFVRPEHAIAPLRLHEGMRVADFGVGSGALAFAMAQRVGHSGRVFAIDIQKELLARISREAAHKHLGNLEVVWGDLDKRHGTKLADASVDAVLISNLLFQSTDVAACAAEAMRIIKPGGKILIIEWSDSFANLGPAHGHVVRESEAKLFFTDAGFLFNKREDAGDHHYSLLFHKA